MSTGIIGRNTERKAPANGSSSEIKQKMKTGRWSAVGLLLVAVSLTVLYIYNVTRIDSLLHENRLYRRNLEKIRIENELYTAEIIKLQSAERITAIAEQKLNMKRASQPPQFLQ